MSRLNKGEVRHGMIVTQSCFTNIKSHKNKFYVYKDTLTAKKKKTIKLYKRTHILLRPKI